MWPNAAVQRPRDHAPATPYHGPLQLLVNGATRHRSPALPIILRL
jgi:hypothetical protein